MGEHEGAHLLPVSADANSTWGASPDQIAHGFVPGIRHPHRRELAHPQQPCESGSILSVASSPGRRPSAGLAMVPSPCTRAQILGRPGTSPALSTAWRVLVALSLSIAMRVGI